MSLAILGGTVVDVIFPEVGNLPQWPRHTEFTSTNLVLLSTPPLVTLGGNGANAAYVAARCGAEVTLHTRIGKDPFGEIAATWLQSAGCEIAPAQRQGVTAVNVTAANARHERATFFYAGPAPALPNYPAKSPAPRALLVCGWPHPPIRTMAATFQRLRARGTLTALDVGPLLNQNWTIASLTPALDLLIANAHEAGRLTDTVGNILHAIRKLRAHYQGHIVIKNGAKGAWWVPAGKAKSIHYPAKKIRAINTVGAGDTFNGALLASLVDQPDFPTALRYAARVAASVVASKRGVLGVRP